MFGMRRHKPKGGDPVEAYPAQPSLPQSSFQQFSPRGHHRHAPPPTSHHQQQPYIEPDFTRRPGQSYNASHPYIEPDFTSRPAETYDASEPIPFAQASAGGPYSSRTAVSDEALATLIRKAERYDKLHTLLSQASHTFSEHHSDVRGLSARSVLTKLIDSVNEGGNDDGSNSSESDATESCAGVSESSKLHVVVMTKHEYRSWLRLSDLNSDSNASSGIGRADWLAPMRHVLSEIALTTKRLEMRFGTKNMDVSVQQQHNIERLIIESQFFAGRSLGGEPAKAPKPASVLLANLSDEFTVLATRLHNVHKKAEAGVVPFCRHTMDLGADTVTSIGHTSNLSQSLTSTICDPRMAHVNSDSKLLETMDIAMGYNLIGLAADTMKSYTFSDGSGGAALTPRELVNHTYGRCDDDIRSMLGMEDRFHARQVQPADLFMLWIYATSSHAFHEAQVYIVQAIIDQASKTRAAGACRCAGASARPHSTSTPRAAPSSSARVSSSSSMPSSTRTPSSSSSRTPSHPPSSHGHGHGHTSRVTIRPRREEEPQHRWQ